MNQDQLTTLLKHIDSRFDKLEAEVNRRTNTGLLHDDFLDLTERVEDNTIELGVFLEKLDKPEGLIRQATRQRTIKPAIAA